MMKSPVFPAARSPVKEVMTLPCGRASTFSRALTMICSRPSRVVALSSLSSPSTEVGPRRRLPSTVGVIRMPLPCLEGVRKMVWDTRPPHALSSSRYSPRRGWIRMESSPASLAISSA